MISKIVWIENCKNKIRMMSSLLTRGLSEDGEILENINGLRRIWTGAPDDYGYIMQDKKMQ